MTVQEICQYLDATLLCCREAAGNEVDAAFGADLMSDVLAYVMSGRTLLLTGLVTNQSIRTAELLDVNCIVFVRGKQPTQDMVEMATELGIPLITTPYTMYEASGLLFEHGLPAVSRRHQ